MKRVKLNQAVLHQNLLYLISPARPEGLTCNIPELADPRSYQCVMTG
jgi:hypothetical protein